MDDIKTRKNGAITQPLGTMERQTKALNNNLLKRQVEDSLNILHGIEEIYKKEYKTNIERLDDILQDRKTEINEISPDDPGLQRLNEKKNKELDSNICDILRKPIN